MNAMPEIGLGTAALALLPEADVLAILDDALVHGIKYFDTSALYGGGRAEALLGQALDGARDDILVSTKLGRYRTYGSAAPSITGTPDIWDFTEAATRSSLQKSQDRLRRDKLDIVFLHDIETATELALKEALPTLMEWRDRGLIGKIGAGCNSVAGLQDALRAGADDAVLIAGRWTLLDRSAGEALLGQCAAKGTNAVAGGVLNSGLLSKRPVAGMSFNYRKANEQELAAAQQLHAMAERFGIDLLSAALQFPCRHEAISTLLLGVSSNAQLKSTLTSLEREIPDQFWLEIQPMGLAQ